MSPPAALAAGKCNWTMRHSAAADLGTAVISADDRGPHKASSRSETICIPTLPAHQPPAKRARKAPAYRFVSYFIVPDRVQQHKNRKPFQSTGQDPCRSGVAAMFRIRQRACGADGGTRTRTASRQADFKSAASTVSPRPPGDLSTFAQPFLGLAAESADQFRQLRRRLFEARPLGAAQDQRHPEIAAPEIGIGADLDIRIALLQ